MKIIAVIVTYNRCELLKRCLDALAVQTRKVDDIVVVNNSSTDNTVEMLESRGVRFITQENLGAAAGWHRGIRLALDERFDAAWLMDDDGYPDSKALAALDGAMVDGIACASSIVVREDDPTKFVFPFPILDNKGFPIVIGWPRKLATVSSLIKHCSGTYYPFAHLFNGALIPLKAVQKIGNVDTELFISGDEVDYFFRLRSVGKVISVYGALHFHPDVSTRDISPLRFYYYLKNSLIINNKYQNNPFVRNCLAVCAILGRTARRNGVIIALSYVFGTNATIFYTALSRGIRGKVGRDFAK